MKIIEENLLRLSIHNFCATLFPASPRNNARGLFSVSPRSFGYPPPLLFSSFCAAAPV